MYWTSLKPGLMIYTPKRVYVTLTPLKIMFLLIYQLIVDPDPTNPLLIFRQLQKQIPCFGDQLIRVTLAGAKDLRSGFTLHAIDSNIFIQ